MGHVLDVAPNCVLVWKDQQDGKERFLSAKHMLPRLFDKQAEWKQWKGGVEDYCDVIMEGTKDVLEEVRNKILSQLTLTRRFFTTWVGIPRGL